MKHQSVTNKQEKKLERLQVRSWVIQKNIHWKKKEEENKILFS